MTALSFSTSATAQEVLLLVGKAISCSLVGLHRQLQRLPPQRLRQPRRPQQRQRPQLQRPHQLLQLRQDPLQIRDRISHQGRVQPQRLVRDEKYAHGFQIRDSPRRRTQNKVERSPRRLLNSLIIAVQASGLCASSGFKTIVSTTRRFTVSNSSATRVDLLRAPLPVTSCCPPKTLEDALLFWFCRRAGWPCRCRCRRCRRGRSPWPLPDRHR